VQSRLKGGGNSTSLIFENANRHGAVQGRSVEREITVAALTLGGAVGVFAIAFGVGAVAAGASVAQTCAMSLLVFTGASQFSAVSVVADGGSTGAALGGAMLLAARNAVYGLALSRIIHGGLATRLLAAQWTIDEPTAMATAQVDPHARRFAFWVTGAAVYGCWNLGTLIGALAGSAIDPQTFGLDAAFPAGFVAMVAPQLRRPPGLLVGVLGATICLVLIPFTPVGVPILCSSVAVLVGIPARRLQVESIPGTAGVP
jgi:4-azaleucine resistance transporter AzlC